MRTRRQLTTIGLGGVVALLLGSGLVAMTSDTADSSGNLARSGTYRPQTHDIDIATVAAAGGDCASATYAEAASAVISAGSGTNVDLDTGARVEQASDFCLKNAGVATGRLLLQFTSVTDLESACTPGEEIDPSCGTEGELRTMLRPSVLVGPGTAGCSTLAAASWSTYETAAQLMDASFAPGEVCRVHLTLFQTSGASDATKLAAQSDEVSWTMSFSLQD